jgi:eukaryotic-like serine/threonine-protein kinase
MTGRVLSEQSVFLEALEIEAEPARREYLDRVCGGDPNLRQAVEALLAAHQRLRPLGGTSAYRGADAGARIALSERAGTVIGPYKLLQQIGEGGFGVVFMAEQQQPVRRKVALKVVKPGMDTRQVVARFEAERQALALMDHPHIAQVFDGGETDSGRPYFVMELVRGIPITDFCDQSRLPVRDRLRLFVNVCEAVQHAHQKGIIHRDLKPSNVLVTLHDDKPVVKVIDFGIAKATGQQLTDKTLFTNFAEMIGTPLYMSPEQAQLSGLDIDTRTDIYSLGVLLYELLTGTTPLEEQLRTAAYDELRRIIREEEPARPSTRISTLGQAAVTLCADRQCDPRRLRQLLRGELDWIAMKCLEKDRNRRYATAIGLATDVTRYLEDEPVLACPPSVGYRLRKFVRRYKAPLTTAAILSAALVLGSALSIWQAVEATAARDAEAGARREATAARQVAEDRASAIARDLERLNAANGLIQSGRAHADMAEWARAESDLTQAVECRPDSSHVWTERAGLYVRLGLWDRAAADFGRAVERQAPTSTNAWYSYALLCLHAGDADGYRRTCRHMAAQFAGTTNPIFCDEVARACLLLDNPVMERQALVALAERAAAGGKKPWRLTTLALALYRAGQYDKAMERVQESLALDAGGQTIWNQAVLAMAYQRANVPDRARRCLAAATVAREERLRALLESTPGSLHALWWNLLESEVHYHEAKELIDGSGPPDDPRPWVIRARALEALGRLQEAVTGYSKAIEVQADFAAAWTRRGVVHAQLGQWLQARNDHARGVELDPQNALALNALAWLLATCPDATLRDPGRAVALAEKAVALRRTSGNCWNTLGVARYRAEDWRGALAALVQSLKLRQGRGPTDGLILAMVLWRLDRKDLARRWFAHAVDAMERNAPDEEEPKRFRAEAAALLGLPETSAALAPHYPVDDASLYALVLETDPGAGWVHARRGTAHAERKQWELAAADFAKATERQPDSAGYWYDLGAAHLGAGDVAAYRRVRTAMLKRFGASPHPGEASQVLYISVVAPAPAEEQAVLVQLSKRAFQYGPNNGRIVGAALLRAGQYEDAIRTFDVAEATFPRRAWDWLFLAIAHHQLGHADQARHCLQKADEMAEQANRASNVWIGWQEPVEIQHLRQEAESLIRNRPPPERRGP